MNKYWAHKLKDLLNGLDNDLCYASGKESDSLLEELMDDVSRLAKHKHYPLPQYLVQEFNSAIENYQVSQWIDLDSLIEDLKGKVDRLSKMLDEDQAHERFLLEVGPLMVKEDQARRRTEFSEFVDRLVRNGEVEHDVASQWSQPLEFV